MKFNIILAHDKKFGIGKDNKLPWRYKSELHYFKDVTTRGTNPVVIMGKNTWYSLPESVRPLPERQNIVVTRGNDDLPYMTLEDALRIANNYMKSDSVWVIGGAMLYTEAIEHPDCEYVYATLIDKDYECDTFFDLRKYNLSLVSQMENLAPDIIPKVYQVIH